MKFLKFLSGALCVSCCLYILFRASRVREPAPATKSLASFSAVTTAGEHAAGGCALDFNFVPVHHTARRHVLQLFRPLARAAGVDPATFSVEMMRDRRGYRTINAMTCTDSRLIWISVTAWERLRENEAALSLMLAHELAHGDHRSPFLLGYDAMTVSESQLLATISLRQRIEIAADQRAADIMLRVGFTPLEIKSASRFILAKDKGGFLARASPSHPAGRDRVKLLHYYVGRSRLTGPTLAR